MFREKILSCGIVGGYGPVEIATGDDAFPMSRPWRCYRCSLLVKRLDQVESAAGFFPGGCKP